MQLTDAQRQFVLHWGEMGTRWGINRTVAQIHALLLIGPEPVNAEQIATTLSVARSNVSTSLRELQGWGLVRVSHRLGDRRDYFETLGDVWEMYRVVMDQRKRREIDPTIHVLRKCVEQTEGAEGPDAYTRRRLGELLEFVETMTAWYEQVSRLPPRAFRTMARMGPKLRSLLGEGRSSKGGRGR